MRIVVMGSGGVGGYIGARLQQSGCDVTFIARGVHGAAMRADGLKVTSALGDIHLKQVHVTESTKDVGVADVVLVGVKLWDTEAAAEAVRPLIGPDTAVISFQNGVIKDDILAELLGRSAVAGGVCYMAATIASPGVIAHTGKLQRLVFGEYGGAASARLERFMQVCRKAGLDAEISSDISKTIWEKFVFLVALSATTSATRLPIGKVRSDPRTRLLLEKILQEVVAVGKAQGVQFNSGFVAERLLFCDQLSESMTSSMALDLERGNKLEVQWLSGDVVRRGKELGVPTPANEFVWDILAPHAAGQSIQISNA